MQRTCIVLIGPKGAGKSFLGAALQSQKEIPFISTEALFLKAREENVPSETRGAYVLDLLSKEIAEKTSHSPATVSFETTGTNAKVLEYIEQLKGSYRVILVKVWTPIEVCIQRISIRNAKKHVPHQESEIRAINQQSEKLKLAYSFEVDTSAEKPEEMVKKIAAISGGDTSIGKK